MMDARFVGLWRLVSCTALKQNGVRVPIYGRDPEGRLYYDQQGNMAVQIMKRRRPRFPNSREGGGSSEDKQIAYEGYQAYFSRCSVEPQKGLIHHEVIGSLFPNWTGTVQTRYFAFEGENRLILSSHPIGTMKDSRAIVDLVWERGV
jgi:hypothetical protein